MIPNLKGFRSHYVAPFTNEFAKMLQHKFLCDQCWNHLNIHPSVDKDYPGYWVLCAKCGTETRGYVSKSFVEQRRQESMAELAEARRNLQAIIPSPESKKSTDQLLEEIGF